MNFRLYHVSKNLFDKDNTTIYKAYFNNEGEWLISDDASSIKFPCSPNTQYTLSIPDTLTIFRIYESSNPNLEPSTPGSYANQITRNSNVMQYTFTTSSTAQILLFQGTATAVNEWFNGLMLNLGSSALPYEPYSSEVWHDLTQHIMSTTWQDGSAYERESGAWT